LSLRITLSWIFSFISKLSSASTDAARKTTILARKRRSQQEFYPNQQLYLVYFLTPSISSMIDIWSCFCRLREIFSISILVSPGLEDFVSSSTQLSFAALNDVGTNSRGYEVDGEAVTKEAGDGEEAVEDVLAACGGCILNIAWKGGMDVGRTRGRAIGGGDRG